MKREAVKSIEHGVRAKSIRSASRLSKEKDAPRPRSRSPRGTVTQKHLRFVRTATISALAIIVLCVIGYASWKVVNAASFKVKDVRVAGGETVPHSRVEKVVRDVLFPEDSPIIPPSFYLTFNPEDVRAQVVQIPRVRDAQVIREGSTVVVSFSEYSPHALWCNEAAENPTCYFVDKEGVAYQQAPNLRGVQYLRYVYAGKEPTQSAHIPNPEVMEKSDVFCGHVRDTFSMHIAEAHVMDGESIRYKLVRGGSIIVSTKDDAEYAYANLKQILDSKKYAHLTKNPFVYIDLRFGNRVFVKEKEVEEVATITTEQSSATSSVMKLENPTTTSSSSQSAPPKNVEVRG